jgi:uncharacterized protein (TIGR02145 family)
MRVPLWIIAFVINFLSLPDPASGQRDKILPPTEQDCLGAIPVCQPIYTTTQSYTGHGNVYPEIVDADACPLCMDGEKNDVFYVITVQTSGILRFTLTPVNPNNDYDWSLFNMTNANCSELYSKAIKLQVSCNSYGSGGINGPTGINTMLSNDKNCNGPGTSNGPAFNKDVPVNTGETYLLNISNWSSVNQQGYTLDFAGSTAQIFDDTPPAIDSIQNEVSCSGTDSLYLRFSENIKCSDIQDHPEKFTITAGSGTYTITGVTSPDCVIGGTQTFGITLLVSPLLYSGSYDLHIIGDIGDLCGNLALYQDYPFQMTGNNILIVTISNNTPAVCSGELTNIALSVSIPGAALSWTASCPSLNVSGYNNGTGNLISDNLVNSGSTPETVTYSVSATANGCTSPLSNTSVIVNPLPGVSNSPMSSQLCSPGFTNLLLQSNVAGTNFGWTATGTLNVTGYGPGNGTMINQYLTNLVFTPEIVVYHITPAANGCSGMVYDYTVTISQEPDVYFTPPAQTICSGATSYIEILSHMNGTTFSWTAFPSSGNLSGYSNGTGAVISQSVSNSGNSIETVTYTITPSAAGCPPGSPESIVLTVNPKPVITNLVTTSQVCSGSSASIIIQSDMPGAVFTWIASGSSPDVTGFSDGSGPSILQNLINTGYNTETVTYTVTPSANGCTGNPVIFTVTVFPVPDVYFNPNGQTLCSGSTTSINNIFHVAGTIVSWTAFGSSPLVTGFGPGSGNSIQQTLFNTSFSSQTVTYIVSPVANGCPGNDGSVVVTVHRNPSVTFLACFDTMTTLNSSPILLTGALPYGGTYSGTGVTAGIFNPGLAGAGVHSINYTFTNASGCSSMAAARVHVLGVVPFTCGNMLTDIRDSRTYPTVLIGSQCWMAANLNFGDEINSGQFQRDNCIQEKYCFSDNPANCTTIGGMYQWDEVMQYNATEGIKGICPPEWHVPAEAEWNSLFSNFVSNGFAGSALKYSGYSGFNTFLYGMEFNSTQWNFSSFATMLWSSTPHGQWKAWAHGFNSPDPSVSIYPSSRSNAFNVRCIKN